MPLFNWKRNDIEDKIIGIQKWIAVVLFIVLIGLIVFNAFGDKDKAQMINNSYLPIISGWIGIILGFYFSRELAGIISQKLKDTRKNYREDIERIEDEFEEFKEDVTENMISILRRIKKGEIENGKRER